MVANTFTTEFSIPGAPSVSAAAGGGVAPCAAAPRSMHKNPQLSSARRLKDVMYTLPVQFAFPALFPIHREGEQSITRIDVDAAVHNGRAAVIQIAAARLDAVLGCKVPSRVEVPEDFAVDGRIGAQMAIHRTREGGARHDRDRLRLGMPAIVIAPSADRLGRGGVPARDTGLDIERRQTSGRICRL